MGSIAARKVIAVIASTGAQGSSVVQTFHADPEYHVRALTRSPESEKAQSLLAKYPGIELVKADLDDVASLDAAFQGVHVIFGNTDFWSLYIPENASKAAADQPLNEWCYEQEIQQGKNIWNAAARVSGLERLVYSTLADVKRWSNGKYEYVLHFQSKAEISKYGRVTYPLLWQKTSQVQLGFYLENWVGHPWLSPTKGQDGVYEFSSITSADMDYPLVSAREDTGPVVAELVRHKAGQTVIIYREQLPISEFIESWSAATGKEARVVPLKALPFPPEMARELDETFKFVVEFGYWAQDDKSVITPEQLNPDLELGSVEQWIRKQNWESVTA